MPFERLPRRLVDDRAHIGGEQSRIADPELRHRACQHWQQPIGDVVLHIKKAQGRAALPGAVESGNESVGDDLLGERRRIDDHRILPTGFGDQWRDRTGAGRQALVDRAPGLGRAGKRDPGDPRIGDQRGADRFAVSRQQMQDIARYASRQQMPHRRGSDERGLFGRLGNDGIAGGERGRDLAGEDRQRKIPRRDAGEDAATVQPDLILLAGRAGQALRHGEFGARAGRVIAQEIDGLAHLRQGGRYGAAALANDQRHQRGAVLLVEIGGAFENRGALFGWRIVPARRGMHSAGERLFDRPRSGRDNGPDLAAAVAGIEDRDFSAGEFRAADNRRGTRGQA